jgi:adenylate cyclase
VEATPARTRISAPASAPEHPHDHHSIPKRRGALAAGLALLWCVFALLAQFSGALDAFEQPLLDWRQALAAYPHPPSDQLALVAIDAIPPDRPWPWSRFDYSLVLRSLIDYAPQSVVFDMNLNDRDTEYTSFDEVFSHVVERANLVIFAATVMTAPGSSALPAKLGSIPYHGDTRLIPRFNSAIWPLDTFAGDSPVGVNNVQAEAGLELHRLPLVFMLDRRLVPSLVLQAVAQFLGADLSTSEIQVGRAIFLRDKDGQTLRTIPIDDQGRVEIRFRPLPSTSWQAAFDNVLVYDDQMQHGIPPDRDLRELARRQVWIGRTDPGERERFTTPVGKLNRVQAELEAERTILDQDYVRPLPPMILAAFYIILGVAGAIAVVRLGPLRALAGLVLVASFWVESSLLVFRLYNVILPLPSFAMLVFGAFAMGLLALYWELDPEPPQHGPLPHEV